MEFAIKYRFKTSNNERVGATRLVIHSDSQLITQQLNGKCEVRDARVKDYL